MFSRWLCSHPWLWFLPFALLLTSLAGEKEFQINRQRPYHSIPYHTIAYHCMPLHAIAYHCMPLHTISGATAAYQPIQTTETNLRVSISMFISGLWTVLALLVVGPVTFIDEAMFSILRCLIVVVFVCSDQRRLVFPEKSNHSTLPRLQVFIRGHFLDVQLHRKRSGKSCSPKYSQFKWNIWYLYGCI